MEEGTSNALSPGASRHPDLANAPETFREILADACRVYLEVNRDILQFLPKRRRRLEAEGWELALVSHRLLSLLNDLSKASAENRLLAHIVIRNIKWLTGEQMEFDAVQSEFATCLNSLYPMAAWAAIAHLLQMSLRAGMRSWRVLHRRLKEAHREDYLVKNYESLLLAFLAMVVSRIGLFFPTVAGAAIRIAYGLHAERAERQFNKQLVKWERWKEEWRMTGIVLTEIS